MNESKTKQVMQRQTLSTPMGRPVPSQLPGGRWLTSPALLFIAEHHALWHGITLWWAGVACPAGSPPADCPPPGYSPGGWVRVRAGPALRNAARHRFGHNSKTRPHASCYEENQLHPSRAQNTILARCNTILTADDVSHMTNVIQLLHCSILVWKITFAGPDVRPRLQWEPGLWPDETPPHAKVRCLLTQLYALTYT